MKEVFIFIKAAAVTGVGGRQVLFEDENKPFNFGGVGRIEYTGLPGFAAGGSYYSAGASQGDPVIGHAHVTLGEVDLQYRVAGLDLTGLALYPHPEIAIKADWERWKDGTNDVASRWNLGLGYQF